MEFYEILYRNYYIKMVQKYRALPYRSISTFYCCRRNKFVLRILLCSTQCLCCWQWLVAQQRAHNTLLISSCHTCMRTCHSVTLYLYCLSYFFAWAITTMKNISLKVRGHSQVSTNYIIGCVWKWMWPTFRHNFRHEHEGTEEENEMNNLV